MPFAGFRCNLLKSHEHRTRDLFSCFICQYILLHVLATPQPSKHGSVGTALCWLNLQLERAVELSTKYDISFSEFVVPAGARLHGGFVALVVVGHTSSHFLKEFKDTSGGHKCWERKLLISHEQTKVGLATELLQPRLFCCRTPAAAITGVFVHFWRQGVPCRSSCWG